MIATVSRVLRVEGLSSAVTRSREYAAELARDAFLLARHGGAKCDRLNVIAAPLRSGFGGVAVQLRSRLACERRMRTVALLRCSVLGGLFEVSGRRSFARRLPFTASRELRNAEFADSLSAAIQLVDAKTVHLEGAAGVPLLSLIDVLDRGARLVVSLHDFALWSVSSHLDDAGSAIDADGRARREAGAELLRRADAIVFPSRFLLERHAALFGLSTEKLHVVEPGIDAVDLEPSRGAEWKRIAFASAFQEHKGAGLLPWVMRDVDDLRLEWHFFGGGDHSPVRNVLRHSRFLEHGYYEAGALSKLLVDHQIDLLLLPSIVTESFSLTVSEAWAAGVPVLAFDHGAVGDRIRRDAGGWLVPPSSGATGLADAIRQWSMDRLTTRVVSRVQTAQDSAEQMIALYERLSKRRTLAGTPWLVDVE